MYIEVKHVTCPKYDEDVCEQKGRKFPSIMYKIKVSQ